MNYRFYVLLFLIASCAVKKPVSIPPTSAYYTSVVLTPDFEKYDFRKIDSAGKLLATHKITSSSEGNVTRKGIQYVDGYYNEYDDNGELLWISYRNEHGIVEEKFLNKYLTIRKEYYSNGNIKQKWLGSWLGFSIGKVYYFGEDGKLNHVVDSDEDYNFNYSQVMNFCKKNGINLGEKKIYGVKSQIFKIRKAGSTYWSIQATNYKKGAYDYFVLDGKTGKVEAKGSIKFPAEG